MKNIKKISLGMFSLSAVFLLAACSIATDESMVNGEANIEPDSVLEKEEEVREGRQAAAGQGLERLALEITLDDALDVFFARFNEKDIQIKSIELKEVDSRYVYQIDGWDEKYAYEIKVDAETSEQTDQIKEEEKAPGDILDIESVISPLEAMKIALDASGSGYVEEWTLEVKNKQSFYSIDISDGKDQKVDALTGEIIE